MFVSIAFRSDYGTLCGMLNITISSSISRENLLRILEILQTQLETPYKTNGIINAPVLIEQIQNISGESCIVRLDRNLEAYGVEEILEMLEVSEQKLVVFKECDTHLAVSLDEEGSSSMIEDMLVNYVH